MARIFTLLSLCLTVVAASATPVVLRDSPISLPLVRRFNLNSTGAGAIIAADHSRAEVFKNVWFDKGENSLKRENLIVSNADLCYTAEVGIGSHPTRYTLIVDTGGANTFVGANKSYAKTSTSHEAGKMVSVTCGTALFSGEQYIVSVTISNVTILNQGISIANQSSGWLGFDGILGVGPADLTEGTVSDTNNIPTVMDNAYTEGLISAEILGISFLLAPSGSSITGTLDLDGTDSSKYTGELNYVHVFRPAHLPKKPQLISITETSPASKYVGVNQTVTYGEDVQILSNSAGIVDTGTTLLFLATDAFDAYQQATGAETD